jgi:hypothetical protein
MNVNEYLAAKPEAFRWLLDDAEKQAAYFSRVPWLFCYFSPYAVEKIIDLHRAFWNLQMIRAGRMAFKNWDCV